MKIKTPIYLKKIIQQYPSILSGRKNIKKSYAKIIKIKELIKQFNNKKSF